MNFPKPHTKGLLKVSDIHSINFEVVGNPMGKTVLFLHGGPGVGFDENDKRFFDFEKLNVIFFDQRGSGKSKPFASLQANTTQDLVSDINKLLTHLGIEKVFLFGGSWGATLALIYAIQHSDKVSGMLLRGTFLCNSDDIEHFLGGGIKNYFPEAWERFVKLVPEDKRDDIMEYYLNQMTTGDVKTRDTFAYEWSLYEVQLLKMNMTQADIERDFSDDTYKSLAPLEAHYMVNHGFIPDNYILEHASSLSHIPTSIVHGRYDFICPPTNSYNVHKKIKGSQLHYVIAAHSSSEPEIEKKLIEEMKKLSSE